MSETQAQIARVIFEAICRGEDVSPRQRGELFAFICLHSTKIEEAYARGFIDGRAAPVAIPEAPPPHKAGISGRES